MGAGGGGWWGGWGAAPSNPVTVDSFPHFTYNRIQRLCFGPLRRGRDLARLPEKVTLGPRRLPLPRVSSCALSKGLSEALGRGGETGVLALRMGNSNQ